MINKRLLIKNLLAHNDECSFYDKKRQLNLHTKEGKAKFLKHICALSNSNPSNNSSRSWKPKSIFDDDDNSAVNSPISNKRNLQQRNAAK